MSVQRLQIFDGLAGGSRCFSYAGTRNHAQTSATVDTVSLSGIRTLLVMMTLICRVDFLLVAAWMLTDRIGPGVDEGGGPKLSALSEQRFERRMYAQMNWWQADWNQLIFCLNIQPLTAPLCVVFLTMSFKRWWRMKYDGWSDSLGHGSWSFYLVKTDLREIE